MALLLYLLFEFSSGSWFWSAWFVATTVAAKLMRLFHTLHDFLLVLEQELGICQHTWGQGNHLSANKKCKVNHKREGITEIRAHVRPQPSNWLFWYCHCPHVLQDAKSDLAFCFFFPPHMIPMRKKQHWVLQNGMLSEAKTFHFWTAWHDFMFCTGAL
jgi:hypothetical protein